MLFSATLDGAVGACPRLHRTASRIRGRAPAPRAQRGEVEHHVRRRHARRQAQTPDRAARGRARARARLRPHEARGRQARPQARPPAQHPGGRDAREPLAEPARARALAVRDRSSVLDARRHRRRRTGPRRRRHHARDQLRSAPTVDPTTSTASAAPAAQVGAERASRWCCPSSAATSAGWQHASVTAPSSPPRAWRSSGRRSSNGPRASAAAGASCALPERAACRSSPV